MMTVYPRSHSQCASIADIEVQYELGGQAYDGRLIRITFDGILLYSSMPPPIGSEISVTLMRGKGVGLLRLPATVSWTRAAALAAEWRALEPRQIRALDGFVLALSRAALGLDERDEEPLS